MEIVKHFVYGLSWGNASYAVVRYVQDTKTDYFKVKNKQGKHPEDLLIKDLESLMEQRKLGSHEIKIYISNSPCNGCCKKLVDFVGTARSKYDTSLKVVVVFSSFYGVRRPSHEKNPKHTGYLPSESQHKDQVKWLKKLQEKIVLKTFTKNDWQELLEATGVNDFDINSQKEEDDLLRKDFEIIMNLNITSIRVPEENGFTNSLCLKGTILQPKTSPAQEAYGDGSNKHEESTTKIPITAQMHNVQTAPQNLSECQEIQIVHSTSQDLSSKRKEALKVRCQDSGTIMATKDTEAVETGPGGTGRVCVEKGNRDNETQTEPWQSDHFTPEKVKADKETETVEKEKLEKETQSEPLQSYKITVDKEMFKVEMMELKLQVARRQHELEMEILQSKKECSRLKQLKLYYEVRKLERQLGVPENTRITADVPFKVDD